MVHYTQDRPDELRAQGGTPRRWDGIRLRLNARKGQFPHYADCSSFASWCLWNGLFLGFGIGDTVNGQSWSAGWTGSMLGNGREVALDRVQRGDCVIYGAPGTQGRHTAVVVGRRRPDGKPMVVSHGSEDSPAYVAFDYRSDVMQLRRYI